MKTKICFLGVLTLLIALFAATLFSISYLYEFYFDFPSEDGGTVIVTNAGIATGRDIAITLAVEGYHVLACVSNEAELRSFAYENLKGLEPIVFNINNPADIAILLYRIKELKRFLAKDLYALIINNAG